MYDKMLETKSHVSNPYPSQPSHEYSTQYPMNPPTASLPFRDGMAAAAAVVNQRMDRSRYPKVKYWFKEDWTNTDSDETDATIMNEMEGTRGPGRVSQGINVTARFVEDPEGNILNGWRVTDMRNLAQQIFHQLLRCNAAPVQWRRVSRDSLLYYLSEMYSSFPELRLCDSHWKANRLASRQYSGWYRNNVSKKVVKLEVTADKPKSQSSKKRPPLTISTQISKKSRPLPTPVRSSTPIRSPSPDDFEYLDNTEIPASVFDNRQPANIPEASRQSSAPPNDPASAPVDFPTPNSLPTPILTEEDAPDTLQDKNSEAPVSAPQVQQSPLDILADASEVIAATATSTQGADTSSIPVSISNPL